MEKIMKKIETLTEQQKAKFTQYIQEWTNIGLSTEPANRKEAEDGVREAYKIAGLESPVIVWCGSPLSNGLVRSILVELIKNGKIEDIVKASVGDSVGASVGASVRDSVRASVGDSVWDSVWASVGASVRASVWASVGDSVRDSVWASVGDSVRDSVRASVRASGYGQHDANWLGFYDYFFRECDLIEETKKLNGLWKIAKNAGWFLPNEKICFISERPNKLNRDEQGRLHSETEAALSYPDGWNIYAYHGIRVPEFIIMSPETITVEMIEAEENQEIKRVMIERFGMGRYMQESGCVEEHRDEFGILLSKERDDMPIMKMVKVVNGSVEGLWRRKSDGTMEFTPDLKNGETYKKEYFLRVPPTTKTALEGVAWTYDIPPNEYKKLSLRT